MRDGAGSMPWSIGRTAADLSPIWRGLWKVAGHPLHPPLPPPPGPREATFHKPLLPGLKWLRIVPSL
jgi:hypothetical protein